MQLDWFHEEVKARCPVCGVDGQTATVLTTDHVLPDHPPVTLLRCPCCGAAFLDDLTTPDYEGDMQEMLDYYVEQGAGIDLIVAPLRRVPSDSVRSCLEIGCSFGYALDFSRHAFGWEVLGVDPSPLAVKGAAALGIPVCHAYFNADLDLGPEPFDLVLCSEILEHVAEPHSLLASIRERLSPGGLLVLSTPNLEIVRQDAEEGMLARALSAGLHLILYSRNALSLILAKEGFTDVLIEESPETLRVFAARTPAAIERLLPPDPEGERTLLRNYLGARTKDVPPSSVLASGLGYRHFKECVNAGLYEEATESRACLSRIYRERYGLDFDKPSTIASGPRLPFNLTGALFFSGILELNSLSRPDRAAGYFSAAIDSAATMQEGPCPFALFDGETEGLLRQSLKHLPMALAATDPERAVRQIELLELMDRAKFSSELLDEARNQTFVRLVNAGAYSEAECLAPRIASWIDSQSPEARGATIASLDPLFCLAMLALQQGRAGQAAELFRRVGQAADRYGVEERRELARSARYHEELSRQQAEMESEEAIVQPNSPL
jgi:2-polyprenyl-3-methyl-5-hydroxy-6-metoxy-1,4-benzoquinol methylase